MLQTDLVSLFDKDITKLKTEIESYGESGPDLMWQVIPGTSNSAGHLTLHLCGNLRHFIGALIGHTGYIRQRDLEFSSPPVSTAELIELIEQTRMEILPIIEKLPQDTLKQTFPQPLGGTDNSTGYTLLQLLGHFSYHLGQINYHRRFISRA